MAGLSPRRPPDSAFTRPIIKFAHTLQPGTPRCKGLCITRKTLEASSNWIQDPLEFRGLLEATLYNNTDPISSSIHRSIDNATATFANDLKDQFLSI
jgi:hypothetical protein